MENIVYVAVAILGMFGGLATVGLIYAGYRVYKCLSNLEVQLTKFNEHIAIIPPMLEGVNNICKSLTESTLKMNGSVENFQKTLFSGKSESGRLNPYSDEEAGKSWDIMEMMRERGISREQAAEIVQAGLGREEGTFNVL